jgi:hypothetical protein
MVTSLNRYSDSGSTISRFNDLTYNVAEPQTVSAMNFEPKGNRQRQENG